MISQFLIWLFNLALYEALIIGLAQESFTIHGSVANKEKKIKNMQKTTYDRYSISFS